MLGRRQEMSLGEESFAAQGEKVGLGQYLVTQAQEAFRQTTTGVLIDQTKQRFSDLLDFGGGEEGATLPERFAESVMTKAEWEQSPEFRPGIEVGEGTTRARARIMAANFDDMQARKEVIANRPEGALATALGFGAAIIGSIPDPINAIPFGTVVKGGKALHTIGRAALEGAAGNLAVSAVTRPYWEEQGEESEWQDYGMDAILGAGVGALFGVGGAAVRAMRKTSTAADRATIARGVEAVAAGESPAMVDGLEDATKAARVAAGLDAESVRFAPEPEPLRPETFEPLPRSIEDPDGVLSFVDDAQIAEIEALPREQWAEADRVAWDDADFASREADKAAEAYARAVECVM